LVIISICLIYFLANVKRIFWTKNPRTWGSPFREDARLEVDCWVLWNYSWLFS